VADACLWRVVPLFRTGRRAEEAGETGALMGDLVKMVQDFWTNLASGQTRQLGYWNYALLALLVVVEGPIATLLGAAAAAEGLLRPGLVFVTAAVSNSASDMLWYLLGYLGKTDWLLRRMRWLGLRQDHIERLKREMRVHAGKILFIAKLTESFSIPALVAAGLTHISWWRCLSVLIPAECIWTGGLVLGGYYFSQSIKHLEQGLQIVAVLGVLVVLVLVGRYLRRHYNALWNLREGQPKPDPPGTQVPQDPPKGAAR